MIIVLDSNVIISAFLFGGPPARLLEHALADQARCFTSLAILDEVRDVLRRTKFGLSPNQALCLIEELHALCEVVTPTKRIRAVAADPDDNAILECAVAANAELIVSGDSHLLDLGHWEDIRIVSPSKAITEIEGQQGGAHVREPRRGSRAGGP